VKPKVAPSIFPAPKAPEPDTPQQSNTSKRRAEPVRPVRRRSTTSDDFGDDGIDDDELRKISVPLGDLEFEHIDNFANPMDAITRKNTTKNKSANAKSQMKPANPSAHDDDQEPVQLANGKWACNHSCKDKNACKHLCCKDGMDKPPKKTAPKRRSSDEHETQPAHKSSTQKMPQKQSKLQLTAPKRKISSAIETLDLTQQEKKKKADYANNGPRDFRGLHQLHKNIQKKDVPSTLHSVMHKKPAYCYSQGGEHNLSFLQQPGTQRLENSSDYGDIPLDDELSTHFEQSQPAATQQDGFHFTDEMSGNDLTDYPATAPIASRGSDLFGDDDSLLGDAMIGLADSQNLQETSHANDDSMGALEEMLDMECEAGFQDDDFPMDIDYPVKDSDWQALQEAPITLQAPARKPSVQKSQIPCANNTSSSHPRSTDFKPTNSMSKCKKLDELKQPKAAPRVSRLESSGKTLEDDIDVLDFLDDFDEPPARMEKPVPKVYKDLEPWLFEEFGDIVELVDE